MADQDGPLYRRIAEVLRASILSGELAPGSQLPSENDLKDRFATTRVTVRKSLALLKADGLLVSSQGKGVFVRSRPNVQMLTTGANFRIRRDTGEANYNAEAAAQGLVAEQELLSVETMPAPAEVADRFGFEVGTAVVVRRRLFRVDGEPMQLVDGYYSARRFAGTAVGESRRIRGGVSGLIEDPDGPIRQRIVQFVEDLEIRMPKPDEAEALKIPPGVPVARVIRTGHVASGEVIEVLDSLVPCDRHLFRYVIDVP